MSFEFANLSNAASDEAKNPPEDIGEADPGGETQGDITMDNDNLDATRDNDNMDVTRDDDNLDATRDTRSRASPTGIQMGSGFLALLYFFSVLMGGSRAAAWIGDEVL